MTSWKETRNEVWKKCLIFDVVKIARYFIYFGKKIVTYNDDVSMDWCEISLTKNDVPDQIKITD